MKRKKGSFILPQTPELGWALYGGLNPYDPPSGGSSTYLTNAD